MKISSLVLSFLIPLSFAHAGSLAGTYTILSACNFALPFTGKVSIPAGKVVVSENVPYTPEMGQTIPAIIFQSGDDFHSVLTLPIGRYAPFAYGAAPYAIGRYARPDYFQENYSSVNAQGQVDGVIVLIGGEHVLELRAANGKTPARICQFVR